MIAIATFTAELKIIAIGYLRPSAASKLPVFGPDEMCPASPSMDAPSQIRPERDQISTGRKSRMCSSGEWLQADALPVIRRTAGCGGADG
jgi:hypothetical protein